MIFKAKILSDQVGDDGRNTSELCMAEVISCSG
jgi:hypothetical protein